jgi:hypothetical protein
VGIDDDLHFGERAGPGRRESHVGTSLFPGTGRLPEHHVPAAGSGEDDLRALLAAPLGDDVVAAPRRLQACKGIRSMTSGASGHSVAGTGWQYKALVRGQVPLVRKTRPPEIGTRTR